MIKINGMTQSDLGILIKEPHNIIGRAPIKYEVIEIEGSSTPKYDELGYTSINKKIDIQILDISKIDLILSVFKGKIRLDYENRHTYANVYGQVDISRLITIREATISLIREPFWYVDDDYVEDSINQGNVESSPLIKLVKNVENSCDITIAGVRFTYSFNDDPYVIIDTESGNVNYEGLLRNRNINIGWEYPSLSPGENKVTINSGDPYVLFKRKDRYL